MKKLWLHILLLIVCFVAVYIWQNLGLDQYTPPLLGFLTVLYILTSFKRFVKNSAFSIFILITCVLLLIYSTGGLESILFFLFYFLSFSVAFILVPETVFLFCLLV